MPILLDNGATIADTGDLPGDLLVSPRQIEFNGLLMGSGTPFRWKELTGWDDMPGIDLSDSARPNDHGDYPGIGLYQPRLPALTLQVRASSREQMESLLELLRVRLSYSDTSQGLYVWDSAKALFANARVIARGIPHTPDRSVGVMNASIQWRCADPKRYAAAYDRSFILYPPQDIGGLDYPLTYPLDYGVTVGSDRFDGNLGDAPAPVVVTFTGPATAYAATLGTGQKLAFDLPLGVGETLTVDTATGTVLLNGTSDRSGWLAAGSVPPEAWRIPPGGTTVSFTTDGFDPALTRAAFRWRDSFW